MQRKGNWRTPSLKLRDCEARVDMQKRRRVTGNAGDRIRQQRDGYDGKREGTRAMLETHMRHDAARDSREDAGW